MEKTTYTLKGAFKRWCELTGDYSGGKHISRAPIWFKVDLLSKHNYSVEIFENQENSRKFKKNCRYSIVLSDNNLLDIKTQYRDEYLQQNNKINRHEYKTTYKE